MPKFPITKSDMFQRERTRLKKLSKLELYEEMHGYSYTELVDDLMETYEEDVREDTIVVCSNCGCDAQVEDAEEGEDGEWQCEDCIVSEG